MLEGEDGGINTCFWHLTGVGCVWLIFTRYVRTYITPTYFCSFYFVGRLRVVVLFCFRFLFWVCFRLFVGFDVICFALLLCVMLFALLLVLLCFVCLRVL